MVKLSIVIPYYKTYELTVKLLERLIPQLTNEIEVYLIDNGCNETRLDKFKEINVIHNDKNYGVSYSRNIGIKKAKGKYIAFIDSDDIIATDYVECLLKLIDTRNEDIIFFNWKDINNGDIVRRPQNPAIWKAIYKKEIVPLFKEDIYYNEDVFFQEDIQKQDLTEYYFDKVLYGYNSNRIGSQMWNRDHNKEIL